MCGRYVVTNAVHKTREIVKSAIAVNDTDNFNASPQQRLPVIKSSNKMSFQPWIFKEPLYVNQFGILEPKNSKKIDQTDHKGFQFFK